MKHLKSLFTLIVLFISIVCTGANSNFNVEPFRLNHRLPTGYVYRIFSDSKGFVWFGTSEGVSRYDGYDIKTFRSSALNPDILSSNHIRCFAEDAQGRIWIGTIQGITIIDSENFRVEKFNNPYTNDATINSMLNDSRGNIWIATASEGILRINLNDNTFIRFSDSETGNYKLKSNAALNLYEDSKGRIWFTSWRKGFGYISPETLTTHYAPEIGNANNPYRLMEDNEGRLWICTWGDGIFTTTVSDNRFSDFEALRTTSSGKLVSELDISYGIVQDKIEGTIWITGHQGLFALRKTANGNREVVKLNARKYHDLMNDSQGTVWLGSVSNGVYTLRLKPEQTTHFPIADSVSSTDTKALATHILQLPDGRIYVVINGKGLYLLDPSTGKHTEVTTQNKSPYTDITSVLYHPEHRELWISTPGDNTVYRYRFTTPVELRSAGSISLSSFENTSDISINTQFHDSQGQVWIGSYSGVYRIDRSGKIKKISTIWPVVSFTEDSGHNIWFATYHKGLYKLEKRRENGKTLLIQTKQKLQSKNHESLNINVVFHSGNGTIYAGTKEGCIFEIAENKPPVEISEEFNITEDNIESIAEDAAGHIWIVTTRKIIRFNPETKAVFYFSETSGNFQGMYFNSLLITRNDQLLAGGSNGICSINLNDFNRQLNVPTRKVQITDVYISNKSIYSHDFPGKYKADKKTVYIPDNHNNIRIEFSDLSELVSGNTQFAYKLDNNSRDWNYLNYENRAIHFSGLAAGKHTLLLKTNTINGQWNEDFTQLTIYVQPPFYKTWWAYSMYIIIGVLVVLFALRIVRNRIRWKQEIAIAGMEKAKTEELNQLKIKYLTNISHELLTPISIILLQIERLQEKYKAEEMYFDTIRENTLRLKRLIKQILVFRKMENKHLKLEVSQSDIVVFVTQLCHTTLLPFSEEKKIKVSIDAEPSSIPAYFDHDKTDKILHNLFTNAVKNTPEAGTIQIKLSLINRNPIQFLRLSVADSGKGIHENDMPFIFNRFFTGVNSDASQSHGIGLSLVKELVQLHRGSIQVNSQEGEGTVFTLELPVSAEAYQHDELMETYDTEPAPEIPETENVASDETLTLLVAEDNPDLNRLIVEKFSGQFTVLSARNGADALNIVKNNPIDFMICDVMMPQIDGLSLCKMIKNDLSLCHIQVVIVTARNSTNDRIACYNAGADAYLSKPFSMPVLDARIQNLMQRKKQNEASFKNTVPINVGTMNYSSIDEEFVNQAVKIVEENLENENLDFEQFAILMSTSKSTIHRKIKALTGMTPGEFIRVVKMKHATQMFDNNVGNISEIAYAVGYSDPKYFSRCFKQTFGITPREYLQKRNDRQSL